jgi:hypothetical protein
MAGRTLGMPPLAGARRTERYDTRLRALGCVQ